MGKIRCVGILTSGGSSWYECGYSCRYSSGICNGFKIKVSIEATMA